MSVLPSLPDWFKDTAVDIWINFDTITPGSVTAPKNIPDEAPGLKNNTKTMYINQNCTFITQMTVNSEISLLNPKISNLKNNLNQRGKLCEIVIWRCSLVVATSNVSLPSSFTFHNAVRPGPARAHVKNNFIQDNKCSKTNLVLKKWERGTEAEASTEISTERARRERRERERDSKRRDWGREKTIRAMNSATTARSPVRNDDEAMGFRCISCWNWNSIGKDHTFWPVP